jgi:hypothetical protein
MCPAMPGAAVYTDVTDWYSGWLYGANAGYRFPAMAALHGGAIELVVSFDAAHYAYNDTETGTLRFGAGVGF